MPGLDTYASFRSPNTLLSKGSLYSYQKYNIIPPYFFVSSYYYYHNLTQIIIIITITSLLLLYNIYMEIEF